MNHFKNTFKKLSVCFLSAASGLFTGSIKDEFIAKFLYVTVFDFPLFSLGIEDGCYCESDNLQPASD